MAQVRSATSMVAWSKSILRASCVAQHAMAPLSPVRISQCAKERIVEVPVQVAKKIPEKRKDNPEDAISTHARNDIREDRIPQRRGMQMVDVPVSQVVKEISGESKDESDVKRKHVLSHLFADRGLSSPD